MSREHSCSCESSGPLTVRSYFPDRDGRCRFTAIIMVSPELARSTVAVLYDCCLAETLRHLVLSVPPPVPRGRRLRGNRTFPHRQVFVARTTNTGFHPYDFGRPTNTCACNNELETPDRRNGTRTLCVRAL